MAAGTTTAFFRQCRRQCESGLVCGQRLLEVLHRLVDGGNSVIVIEHNLDVIKTADWVIDLGPDGGGRGGELIAEGTPEQVAKVKASHTGRYLALALRGEPIRSLE